MLPLPQIGGGQDQQRRTDRSKHRQPLGEYPTPRPQKASRPPGAPQDQGYKHRHRDELCAHVQPSGDFQRNGGYPDDQRRIDLDDVDVEFTPRQPPPRHIQQPRDIVLKRRPKGNEQHDAEDGQQQKQANGGHHRLGTHVDRAERTHVDRAERSTGS